MIDFVLLELVQREVVDIERKRIDFELRPQFEVVGVKLNSFLQFIYNKVHKLAHYERTPLLVEHLKGSQSGEVIFASHLTTPD